MKSKLSAMLIALFVVSILIGLYSFFIVKNDRKTNKVAAAKLLEEKKEKENELKIKMEKIKMFISENEELQNMKNGEKL